LAKFRKLREKNRLRIGPDRIIGNSADQEYGHDGINFAVDGFIGRTPVSPQGFCS